MKLDEKIITWGYCQEFMEFQLNRVKKEKIKLLPPFWADYYNRSPMSGKSHDDHIAECIIRLIESIHSEIEIRCKNEEVKEIRYEHDGLPFRPSKFRKHEEIQGFNVHLTKGYCKTIKGYYIKWGFLLYN